jgi:hypothetical protein
MAEVIPEPRRTRFAGHTCCALGIYSLSLALPYVTHDLRLIPVFGLLAFGHALETLVGCIASPTNALLGDWLLGLCWLANPAAWVGMVFLLTDRTRWAALAGQLSLLLAACAFRPDMLCQYVWLASFVYVLYAALCVPDDLSASNANQARPPLPKLRRSFCVAVALPVLFGLLLFLLDQRGHIKTTPLFPGSDNRAHAEQIR